jgi:hypothetical protein
MKKIISTLIAAALTTTFSVTLVQAESDSSDIMMNNILSDYHHLSQRGQWINPWMPDANGDQVITGISADRHLMNIVATYTREALDRGGWVNSLMHNKYSDADYASGNPLLAVQIGEGLTEHKQPY